MCEFCSTRNVIDIAMEEVPKQGEILYLQEVERSSKDKSLVSGITKDSIVVFCVDTSGSMGQTTEVLLYSITQIMQGYIIILILDLSVSPSVCDREVNGSHST